jgi:diguanylate cyclase (GGDEF)-like protein
MLLTSLTAMGLIGVMSVMLVELRRDAWHRGETTAENLVHVIRQDLERTIETYDLSLQGVVEGLARPDIVTMAPDLRKLVLFDRSLDARFLGVIIVLDIDGNVVLQSDKLDHQVLNNADRDYFQAQRDRPDIGLFLSQPYLSRISGEPVIALSRRVSKPDGSFAGVVAGTLKLAYFRDLLGKLQIGPTSAINLYKRDGTLLMREPYSVDVIRKNIAGSETYRLLTARRSGSFVARAALDNVERLYAFSHLTAAPIFVDVALGVDEMLATWRLEAVLVGASVLVLCLTMIVLMARSEREVRRRTIAEASLNDAIAELARLAETDGLTGLANRRQFDRVLETEMRRAHRQANSIALVMLDVDWFKPFNDRYGHQAGDTALKTIATCIAASLRRPGDVGCRIGGEEFAIILPDTDERGAKEVARVVQMAIAARRIEHGGSAPGIVTASIGIACLKPGAHNTPEALYRAADGALYQAKTSGRNTIRSINMLPRKSDRVAMAS